MNYYKVSYIDVVYDRAVKAINTTLLVVHAPVGTPLEVPNDRVMIAGKAYRVYDRVMTPTNYTIAPGGAAGVPGDAPVGVVKECLVLMHRALR